MTTHTIKGYVTWRTDNYLDDKDRIHWTRFDPRLCDSKAIVIGEQAIEVEVPDDFDPRPAQVAALVKQKEELRAKFSAAVKELDDRINSLLALEMS